MRRARGLPIGRTILSVPCLGRRPAGRTILSVPRGGRLSDGQDCPSYRGLTLFEVLLALGIFVGSLAVISQLLATGVHGALRARLETEAIFRAESALAEVTTGIAPLQNQTVTDPDDQTWSTEVVIQSGPNDQLFVVSVTAAHAGATSAANVSFTVTKMIRDPQVLLDASMSETETECQTPLEMSHFATSRNVTF